MMFNSLCLATLLLSLQSFTAYAKAVSAIPRSVIPNGHTRFPPPFTKTVVDVPSKTTTARRQVFSQQLVFAIIETQTTADLGTCSSSANGGPVTGLRSCIIVGFEVILQQYFNGGVFQPNTLGLSARAEPDALVRSDTLPQFAPVENCTTLCQVKYTAPESTWTFVANTTHASGFTHDVFFAFQGNVSAIRAVRTSDNPKTTSKRQNVNLDDVVVDSDVFLDYYFADEDFDVFLDYNFGSANTQIPIADTVSTFVVQNNIALMCLDFGSNFPNGFADSGVLQINNNDANALLTVGSAVELLTDCNALS